MKSYAEIMREITTDKLFTGLLGHGLFADKLPHVFTSEFFMKYCKKKYTNYICKKAHEWIDVDIMRNTGVPRTLGIPNPFSYYNACYMLKEKWPFLQGYFQEQTNNWQHKVSRIHIRKRKNSKALFEMNYTNWKIDGTPQEEWMIGCKYVVKADISSCFPSIYTHALTWALMGKDKAKQEYKKTEKKRSELYRFCDDIDYFTRAMKNNETKGLLIGPHTSNLLSEVILTRIDKTLVEHNWHYERHIDDYRCYVSTYEDAKRFLVDLHQQLRIYDLNLNYKKTKIESLPLGKMEVWVNQLNMVGMAILPNNNPDKISPLPLDYQRVKQYLNYAIQLTIDVQDTAVLNYAIKVIGNSKKFILQEHAQRYFYNTALYLAGIYPYLLRELDTYVFPMEIQDKINKKSLVKQALQHAKEIDQYEEAYYTIIFDIKYDLGLETELENLDDYYQWIQHSSDCLLKLFGWLWAKKNHHQDKAQELEQHAKSLAEIGEWDKNWLFCYECLSVQNIKDLVNSKCIEQDWNQIKKDNISFLQDYWRKIASLN